MLKNCSIDLYLYFFLSPQKKKKKDICRINGISTICGNQWNCVLFQQYLHASRFVYIYIYIYPSFKYIHIKQNNYFILKLISIRGTHWANNYTTVINKFFFFLISGFDPRIGSITYALLQVLFYFLTLTHNYFVFR